ncbi:DEAD/DEAH box helicase [bacterium]|nr:DEAD/DEAH box helicase [bacterium]
MEKKLKTLKISEAMAKNGIGRRRGDRKKASIEKPKVTFSSESKRLLRLIEKGGNIFLTGKAGTGKTTFLRYFRSITDKNVVVLAPTGVSAVNIQGQTMHSFFKFHPGITENDIKKVYYKDRDIYKNIDILIIDEISMVRSDFFDCIEKFLRINGPEPGKIFGGIQVIITGDLYQLPPIVQKEEEIIFELVYKSPYFFDSNSFKKGNFSMVELKKVYRQTDHDFIRILDLLRTCKLSDEHLEKINSRVCDYVSSDENNGIVLVTTNYAADKINYDKLCCIENEERCFKGYIDGEFKINELPTAQNLFLKEGAQVMLLNNDSKGRWINGDIAKIIRIEEDQIRVMFEDGTFDDVSKYKWEKVKYSLDENGKIRSEIIGSFTQIPIKLAWAVTIHKGQGKTYEKVFVDFGNGTFASGQAYVALSRCRSLEGVRLRKPLCYDHLLVDERIEHFMIEFPKTEL